MIENIQGLEDFLLNALREDIGHGDVTTSSIIPEGHTSKAWIITREDIVLAGISVAERVFLLVDPSLSITTSLEDGSKVKSDTILMEITGKTSSILMAERLSLNLLQRLSGISTLTNRCMEKLVKSKAVILDTRKTTPCMRSLEKYAVTMGGGRNHRFGLFDGILIKDNHIAAVGGISEAIRRARLNANHLLKIEVEVSDMEELKIAVDEGADIIMLDNFSPQQVSEAVGYAKSLKNPPLIEVSGGVTIENIEDYDIPGVDFISLGSITHSVRAVDISLEIKPTNL
ncbi:MAG: carboxylating nicotinate-nucleotide diphosphorylase [Nitrospirae bacterium]|nr:MAG: carboxylating nicotinate-nucleotide diphosphorylase [Nitrospirota bacterium]